MSDTIGCYKETPGYAEGVKRFAQLREGEPISAVDHDGQPFTIESNHDWGFWTYSIVRGTGKHKRYERRGMILSAADVLDWCIATTPEYQNSPAYLNALKTMQEVEEGANS